MGDLASRAKGLASLAHVDQRYGEVPYLTHLDQVVEILHEYGFNNDVMDAIAYLHDALEDTKLTPEALQLVMGNNVLEGVQALTGRGVNRKERQLDLYKKLQKGIPRWAIIKLADRIANFRMSHANGTMHLLKMYVAEHEAFRTALFQVSLASPQVEKMWEDLYEMVKFYTSRYENPER